METQFAEETAQLFSSLEEIQLEVNVIHNQQNEGQNCFLLPWDNSLISLLYVHFKYVFVLTNQYNIFNFVFK